MKFLLFVLLIFFSAITVVSAQDGSGACSWHKGVNCSAGWQPDGTVICNDGSRESVVEYQYVVMCQNFTGSNLGGDMMSYAMRNHTYISPEKSTLDWDTVRAQCEREMYQNVRYIERINKCITYTSNQINNANRFPSCPSNSERIPNSSDTSDYHCRCIEGYYNYPVDSYNNQGYCSPGEAPMTHDERMMMLREGFDNAIIDINNQAAESVTSELNLNSVSSDVPEKQAVPLVGNVKDPDMLCKETYGMNGKYLSTMDGQITCGCENGYIISNQGVCTYVAKKENLSNSTTSFAAATQTTKLTPVPDRKATDSIVWLFVFISVILVSINGIRIYFTSKNNPS
ncbi:hypothetical protein K2P47_03395 [Patescibacteria group bacterium]|nr:hypothetical protein [Patescibacteria group bacterium]